MTARVALRLTAVGLFGIAALFPPLPASVAAVAGVAVMIVSLRDVKGIELTPVSGRLLGGVFALLLLWRGIERGALGYPEPAGVMPALLVGAVLLMAALVLAGRKRWERFTVIIGVVVFVIVAIGVMTTFVGDPVGLDVYRSHVAASDAIRAGENPYTDAVTIEDGSPNAEPGSVIEGYSYPPVTLLGYVGADLLLRDPRWMSALAIIGAVAGLVRLGRTRADIAGATLLMLLAVPLQRAIVWSGWTEPLTLLLVSSGILLWRRELLSPVLLGLALASKQYLVVLVPVLVAIDARPWRRSVLMLVTSVLTLVPAAVADPSAFWFTMVTRPLGLGFRADTRSLSGAMAQLGVSFEVPSWLMLVIVTALGLWLAGKVSTGADLVTVSAAILAATFLLSLAFVNYWWLVQWTAALAAVLTAVDDRPIARNVASASA